ncbi:hypothetical protein [Peribacillus sp. SCS-155]|uniref:hypothetical protein n=1 Tax=Peribacillus sedimenti TaxID=3115297 RepID=UPI003905FBC3
MKKIKKSRDFYESLKIRGLEIEQELNRKIHDFMNKKELIQQASLNSAKFANRVRQLQEKMETVSSVWDFPTKREVADLAKSQVRLEEKIDRFEDMISQLLTSPHSTGHTQVEASIPVVQGLSKQDKKQRLRRLFQTILDKHTATLNQRENSNEG